MPKRGFRFSAAIWSSALSLIGLVAQFSVRLVMTASLGAGPAYDAFLAAMIPAALIATVGFQAVASALLPRLSQLFETGSVASAHVLYRRAVWWAAVSGIVLCAASAVLMTALGFDSAALLVTVLVGWGMLAGAATIQRQLLVYLGHHVIATTTSMLPAAGLLAAGSLIPDMDATGFAVAGMAGHAVGVAISALVLTAVWRRLYRTASVSPVSHIPLFPILVSAIPILLASFNAQAMSVIDQAMAAWFQVGGLTLLSVALAVARLPHTIAETAMMASGYGEMLDSVSAVRKEPTPANRQRTAAIFSRLLEVQTLLVLPAAVGLLVFSDLIISVLFQRGKFGPEDAALAGAILSWYPLAAVGVMLQGVQVPFFVAMGKSGQVLRYEIVLTAFSALLNLAFLPILHLPGLVASTGVSIAIVSVLVFRSLVKLDLGITISTLLHSFRLPVAAVLASFLASLAVRHWLMSTAAPLLTLSVGAGAIAVIYYGVHFGFSLVRRNWRAQSHTALDLQVKP